MATGDPRDWSHFYHVNCPCFKCKEYRAYLAGPSFPGPPQWYMMDPSAMYNAPMLTISAGSGITVSDQYGNITAGGNSGGQCLVCNQHTSWQLMSDLEKGVCKQCWNYSEYIIASKKNPWVIGDGKFNPITGTADSGE